MSDRSINWHFVLLHCYSVCLYRIQFFYIKIKRIRIGRLIIVIHIKITFQISQCNYEAIFYVYLLYRCISTMSDDEHLYRSLLRRKSPSIDIHLRHGADKVGTMTS